MQVCAARGSLEMQDPKIAKKSPSGHHRTTLSDCIFATKARIGNQKELVKQQFGPLTAEIDPVVWGTPANFNKFRVLAALLHGTLVVGLSEILQR